MAIDFMKKNSGKYHKKLAALIIVLSVSSLLITAHITGILSHSEFFTYDLRINFFSGFGRPSDDIIVVLLDQKSIEWGQRERGWGWPWPREAYGEFVNYMNLGNAASVTFDVLFSEPSIYNQFMPPDSTDDLIFAAAADDYGRVVHGVMLSTLSGNYSAWPSDLDVPLFRTENFGSNIDNYDLLLLSPGSSFGITGNRHVNAQFPVPVLRNSAGAIGNLTGLSDSDNIFRRHHFFMIFDGMAVPSLAAAALLASGDDNLVQYNPQNREINWGNYSVPVDRDGKTLLRFRGNLDRYITYSMSDVMQSAMDFREGRTPLLPPDNFVNAYVFFGLFAQGLFDTFSTPIDSVYPGIGVHITMLDNLLSGDFITGSSFLLDAIIIFISAVMVVTSVFLFRKIAHNITGFFLSMIIMAVFAYSMFYAGFWVPLASPVFAALLSFISAMVYSYATEGRDKRFIKHAFGRIISPKVVDEIIRDPSQLKLGGEKRKLTAVFSDVEKFSTIASELQDQYGDEGPGILVNMLNLYLSKMSNIVLANDGTIDKYGGDAIVAFFGAPLWMEDHAVKACRSAVQMKKLETELRHEILNPDGEFFVPMSNLIKKGIIRKERPVFTRIGINSGDMVVGFMGTPDKMDYTIMGNAVNLAARLEGVNKQYYTGGILVSEYTRELLGDEFLLRKLSRIRVVGIPASFRIFELLDIKSDAGSELLDMADIWENAIMLYEDRDFSGAEKLFSKVYDSNPEDSTAKLYRERCAAFAADQPPKDWDGIDNLTEK